VSPPDDTTHLRSVLCAARALTLSPHVAADFAVILTCLGCGVDIVLRKSKRGEGKVRVVTS
jgi:hypothetical protein